jgi:subtilase family serine protease
MSLGLAMKHLLLYTIALCSWILAPGCVASRPSAEAGSGVLGFAERHDNQIPNQMKRLLRQDTSNRVGYDTVPTDPSYFELNPSQAILNWTSWNQNAAFIFQCPGEIEPYIVGVDNPELCLDRIEVRMGSSEFGNVSAVFEKDQLNDLRSTNVQNASLYVYGLPLNKYALPNALYESASFSLYFESESEPVSFSQATPTIWNYFNSSASTLREYYGIDDAIQGTDETVQGSVLYFGVTGSAVNRTAVDEYLNLQGLVPHTQLQISDWGPANNISSCSQPGDPCSETMLDVQTQQAFAPKAVTFFTPTEIPLGQVLEALTMSGYTDAEARNFTQEIIGTPSLEDLPGFLRQILKDLLTQYYKDFIQNVTSSEERIQVASLSWSSSYYSEATSFEILEEGLKELALSGITIFVSSGDAGASGTTSDGCLSADSPMMADDIQESWPTVSPWVTVVGGTQFLASTEDPQGAEVVCNTMTNGGITSGGGFAGDVFPAELFSTPAWQEKAVKAYLSENNSSTFDGFPTKNTPGYNPNGRAFPDISMYAAWFPTLKIDGSPNTQAGTSLSAPTAAAMISLVNQKLLESGYDVVGYANPMIYWMGENCTEAFRDVTIGNNQAGKNVEDCLYGFPASAGWDAATGFGSINFEPLVACAKRYQDEVRNQGLELLPDGTFNLAAARSSGDGRDESSDKSTSGSTRVIGLIGHMVMGLVATGISLL